MRTNSYGAGFTLIEILIVSSILVFTSIALVENFSTSRINVDRAAEQVASDLRLAQSYALSIKKTNNAFRCGYGLTRLNSSSYIIYAGRESSTSDCQSSNRNYNSSQNPIVATKIFSSQTINVYPSFSDVFFEPPGLKTYINNISDGIPPEKIFVRVGETDCVNSFSHTRCRLICVYPSGRIELNKVNSTCPAN